MNRIDELIVQLLSSDAETQHQATLDLMGMGAAAMDALLHTLRHSTREGRCLAAWILHVIDDDRVTHALTEALHDPDPQVQDWSATALTALGDVRAVPALIDTLASQQPSVRRNAALTLGYLGDKQAFPALQPLVHDAAADVRSAAGEAMARLRGEATVDYLLTLLQDSDDWVRIRAIYALALTGAAEAFDGLADALGDRNEWVRTSAVSALGHLKQPHTVELLARPLKNDLSLMVRCACVKALGDVGSSEAVTVLVEALLDSDKQVLSIINQTLRGLGYRA